MPGVERNERWGYARSSICTTLLTWLALLPLGVRAEGIEDFARGDIATKWRVNDADPMAFIPSVAERNADPMEFGNYLQDLVSRAEGSYQKKDWSNTIKYYRVVAKAVPEAGRSYSRLCHAYQRLNEPELAIENCRKAMGMQGAIVFDHVRFLELMLSRTPFTHEDAEQVKASLSHLREHAHSNPQQLPHSASSTTATRPKGNPMTDKIRALGGKLPGEPTPAGAKIAGFMDRQKSDESPAAPLGPGDMHLPTQIEFASCKLAVRTNDMARLTDCMARLRSYRFPERLLFPFRWAQALGQEDAAAAAALLAEAERLGFGDSLLATMQDERDRAFGQEWRSVVRRHWGAAALGVGVLALVGLLAWMMRKPRAVPRSAQV